MKRKTPSTLFTSATDEELLVADILLDLPNIIIKSVTPFKSQHQQQHSFNFSSWTRKRRRSAAKQYRAPSPILVNNNLQEKDDDEFEQIKEPDGADTGTPDTPLDFVSSESNENCIQKRLNNKRSKKQYMKMIEDLTDTNEVLKREVEKVRKYKDNLKELNLKYKEMKEKSQKKEIYCMNLGMQSTEQTREMRTVFYQQPLIEMSQNNPYPFNPISAQMYFSNGLGRANHVDRFDLNISLEDSVITQSQPLFVVERDRRTRCREARRMRRGLMKVRKLRNAYGIKLPH